MNRAMIQEPPASRWLPGTGGGEMDPLYSFIGDWAMYRDILRGRIPF